MNSTFMHHGVGRISRLSTTLTDRSFRIELIRKHRDVPVERFSARQQKKTLAGLRDDLHLVALQHAKEIGNAHHCAEDFSIPAETGDRLRDIAEPLFAIATVADWKQGDKRRTDAMIEAARKLADIRIEHDAADAALVAGPTALKAIARPNGPDLVMSSSGALALFQQTEDLDWIDTKDKARAFLRRLGFLSAVHRLERFIESDRPGSAPETARGYEIKSDIIRDLLGRYASADVTCVTPSRA